MQRIIVWALALVCAALPAPYLRAPLSERRRAIRRSGPGGTLTEHYISGMAGSASLLNRENFPVSREFRLSAERLGRRAAPCFCLLQPVIACFSEPEPRKINDLVLIFFISRAPPREMSPEEAPAGVPARPFASVDGRGPASLDPADFGRGG